MRPAEDRGTPLLRHLGMFDAVVIGLGSMIGAGVFAAFAPAARAAGSGLLIGLLLAAVVAYCNATSSARLAALYPESGGSYVYGRKRLGPFWGYLAGWAFVVGKTASCAAMALTFASYAAPSHLRGVAVGARGRSERCVRPSRYPSAPSWRSARSSSLWSPPWTCVTQSASRPSACWAITRSRTPPRGR